MSPLFLGFEFPAAHEVELLYVLDKRVGAYSQKSSLVNASMFLDSAVMVVGLRDGARGAAPYVDVIAVDAVSERLDEDKRSILAQRFSCINAWGNDAIPEVVNYLLALLCTDVKLRMHYPHLETAFMLGSALKYFTDVDLSLFPDFTFWLCTDFQYVILRGRIDALYRSGMDIPLIDRRTKCVCTPPPVNVVTSEFNVPVKMPKEKRLCLEFDDDEDSEPDSGPVMRESPFGVGPIVEYPRAPEFWIKIERTSEVKYVYEDFFARFEKSEFNEYDLHLTSIVLRDSRYLSLVGSKLGVSSLDLLFTKFTNLTFLDLADNDLFGLRNKDADNKDTDNKDTDNMDADNMDADNMEADNMDANEGSSSSQTQNDQSVTMNLEERIRRIVEKTQKRLMNVPPNGNLLVLLLSNTLIPYGVLDAIIPLCSSLVILDVSNNGLTTFQMEMLPELAVLNAANNHLSTNSSIVEYCSHVLYFMPELAYLDLTNNGPVKRSWPECTEDTLMSPKNPALKVLFLSGNPLTLGELFLVAVIAPHITVLHASRSVDGRGTFPDYESNVKLYSLYLNECELRTKDLVDFVYCFTLKPNLISALGSSLTIPKFVKDFRNRRRKPAKVLYLGSLKKGPCCRFDFVNNAVECTEGAEDDVRAFSADEKVCIPLECMVQKYKSETYKVEKNSYLFVKFSLKKWLEPDGAIYRWLDYLTCRTGLFPTRF